MRAAFTLALLLSCCSTAMGARQHLALGPWAGEQLVRTRRAAFSFRHEGPALRVLEEGQPVLAYNYGILSASGVPEHRRRSCYIHPLYGLDGEILTGDFPRDHYHHRGLYWAWPGVSLGGEKVDHWHLQGVWTRFESWLGFDSGPCCALLGIQNGWYDTANRRVLDEQVWLRVWPAEREGRAIDFDIALRATTVPVLLQGKMDDQQAGYGGFLYRPAAAGEVQLATEGVVAPRDSNRVPARWADFSAAFGPGGALSGVAIFPAPDHPRYPPGWTLRHYGFLGTAWPGVDPVSLLPGGEPLRLRYRVFIHRGRATDGRVEAAWREYRDSGSEPR